MRNPMKKTICLPAVFLISALVYGCGGGGGEFETSRSASGRASSVSAGDFHTCAVVDGGVECWGFNSSGQLGNGSTFGTLAPAAVPGLANVSQVSAGGAHTCALFSDGTVQCWGENSSGQLGNGSTTRSLTPVSVSGITNATVISSGTSHTCARLADSTLRCWGRNVSGQLGNASYTNSSTPVTVSGIFTANGIAAGGSHTCTLLSDGTVRCWGSNSLDQLGNSLIVTGSRSTTPVTVTGISTASAIEAGSSHTCAALTTGGVRCWGDNADAQLGSFWTIISTIPLLTRTTSNTPSFVTGISTATGVTGGLGHSCAVLADNRVECWGENANGQLGNGTLIGLIPPGIGSTGTSTIVPVFASGILSATGVSAGLFHTCAVLSNGRVSCWGLNTSGQLGDGTALSSGVPVQVIR